MAGCKAKPQLRLADHIRRYHRTIKRRERFRLTATAQVVGRKRPMIPPPKGTPSIITLFNRARKDESLTPQAAEVTADQPTSTRSFARFSLSHPKMEKFITFLRGLDGKKKSASESSQIATDVSKYLKFAEPRRANPNWYSLLQAKQLRAYLDFLNSTAACSVSGQITKLDRILQAITYLRLEIGGEEDAALSLRCSNMVERIK